ncbi:MAG: SPFH domain-containing protein [Gammaproteobacteria bacterium]|nr:SPFH domain-containing protein [Gammaproteobacteria bacterium]MDH5653205.1 SPFH domain-containing protein [Gammaproteobacteria bacterium]
MGLWDKITGEFIDVIEWTDDAGGDTLVYRFPTYNKEIQMGSSLTVRETQLALFVYNGQIADLFSPGRYILETENMPVMTTLQHWTHGFNSPFKSDVYYFNTHQFTDIKWGTPNPITLRDADFGVVRIRAFGNYSMRITDPVKMMKEISATRERYTVQDIEDQLRASIISQFSDFLAESKVPFLDHAANLNEFSGALKPGIQQVFDRFGLALGEFNIINISVPPEVEAMLDKRTSMGAVGDLNKFTQFQTASAITDFAKNGGGGDGLAGAGVGAGIGMAMGNALANNLQGNQGGGSGGQGNAEPTIMVRCPDCSKLNAETAKFCSECGYKLIK